MPNIRKVEILNRLSIFVTKWIQQTICSIYKVVKSKGHEQKKIKGCILFNGNTQQKVLKFSLLALFSSMHGGQHNGGQFEPTLHITVAMCKKIIYCASLHPEVTASGPKFYQTLASSDKEFSHVLFVKCQCLIWSHDFICHAKHSED